MRWLKPLLLVVALAYPFAVYFGLQVLEARVLGGILAALLALRLLLAGSKFSVNPGVYTVALAGVAFSLAASIADNPDWFLFSPVAMNAGLLLVFGHSLISPPSVIEQIARVMEPDLPDSAIPYTRAVTGVWCGFFVVNGAIALYTALYSSLAVWTLYNGLIAYLLMGTLFVIEYLVRRRVRDR